MRLRLFENYRFVLYTPFYAAHAIGAYEAEGLEVELLPSPGTGRAEAALRNGAVDAIWAGPMRIIKQHDLDPGSPLVCFAEIVGRDPFSLVGRGPEPGFRLHDLAELRLGTVSEVPTPWLCLQDDLRRAGLDPNRLDRVADRSMAENLAALQSGKLDVVQLFEPFVQQAIDDGGIVRYAASDRGPTSYTVFVATRERLTATPEPFRRMTRAIHKTLRWVHQQPAPILADTIAGYFPGIDRATLTGSIARYLSQEVWDRDPIIGEEGFERQQSGLLSSGFIGGPIAFDACVDNRLAEEIAKETN